MTTSSTDEPLRELAIRRLAKKREFRQHAVAYVVVNSVLVAIWAVTSAGFFWPIFPILGWGIGLFFHGWDAYGKGEPTEEEIDREMRRLASAGRGRPV